MTQEEMNAAFAAEYIKKAELMKDQLTKVLELAQGYADSENEQLRNLITDEDTVDVVLDRMDRLEQITAAFDANGDGTDIEDIEVLINTVEDAKSVAERALAKCQDAEQRISGIRSDLTALQSSTSSQVASINDKIAEINDKIAKIPTEANPGVSTTEVNRLVAAAIGENNTARDNKVVDAVKAGCQAFLECFTDFDVQARVTANREAVATSGASTGSGSDTASGGTTSSSTSTSTSGGTTSDTSSTTEPAGNGDTFDG